MKTASFGFVCALAALVSGQLGCGDPTPVPPAADGAADAAADAAVDAAADAVDENADPVPYAGPDDWCPGRDHCRNTGDGRLYVGVATEDITPTIAETYEDRNDNRQRDDDEPYVDANGNGTFDAYWMAGFGNNRAARGVHDPLEVRAIAFRYNDVTVAWAVIDCVGYFINEVELIRQDPTLRGVDLDKLVVSATHVHEAVDTVGLWGPNRGVTGRDLAFMTTVRMRTAAAVRRAVESARPVRMRVAQVVTVDGSGSTLDYVNDTRDPVIYDPTVTIAQFVDDAAPTTTVATWVNWAAHPEYSGSENTLLSADYVHYLRDTIERGVPAEGIVGVGGTAVFVNGALGGQVGPSGTHPRDASGTTTVSMSGLPKAERVGVNVAKLALQALARDGVESREVAVSYRTAPLNARAENVLYGIAYNAGIFDRELTGFNPSLALSNRNPAWLRSRVTYLQVGPVGVITAPGELHPELWVGFDTMWSWGRPRVEDAAHAPDFSMAPRGPFLRELMLANPGVRYAFVGGLGEDFLGYIVPAYNYELASGLPYFAEAPGDHYEETNSIGPEVERFLQHPMLDLARWRPPTN